MTLHSHHLLTNSRLCACTIVILLTVLLRPAPALAQTPIVHVVQPGENLFRISLRYGTTVDAEV